MVSVAMWPVHLSDWQLNSRIPEGIRECVQVFHLSLLPSSHGVQDLGEPKGASSLCVSLIKVP